MWKQGNAFKLRNYKSSKQNRPQFLYFKLNTNYDNHVPIYHFPYSFSGMFKCYPIPLYFKVKSHQD